MDNKPRAISNFPHRAVRELEFRHHSAVLGRDKVALVVYPETTETLEVCYLLHGFGGNRRSWLRDDILTAIESSRFAFVMPESGRRWFIDDHQDRRYETYLISELLPAVEPMIPQAPNGHRYIGGFSMGGAAAVFLALRHTPLFAAAFAHAGAFHAPKRMGDPYRELSAARRMGMPDIISHESVWGPVGSPTRAEYDPDRLIAVMIEEGRPSPQFYLDVGLDDHTRMITMVRSMRDKLLAQGLPTTYAECAGGHDAEFVGRALPGALRFLEQLDFSAET